MPTFLSLPLNQKFTVAGNWIYKKTHTKPVDLASMFYRVPEAGRKIPNQVFMTWKDTTFSPLHSRQLKKFRERNTDFSFEFYDDKRMNEWMEANYAGHPILEAFRYITVMAAKVDVWRYCILYKEGGVYCDIDSSLTLPLRDLLKDDPEEMLSYEANQWKSWLSVGTHADPALYLLEPPAEVVALLDHPDNLFLTWFLCFAPGNPILGEYIELVATHFPFFKGRIFDSVLKGSTHATGPVALTQAVWKSLVKTKRRPGQFGIDFRGYGQYKVYGSEDRLEPGGGYMHLGNRTLGSEGR
jgi:mannosyltransferase OCH1-like enzyme